MSLYISYFINVLGLAFVEQNGWFILFGAILLFLIWKKIAPSLNATYESWQEGTSNMGELPW